MNKADLEYYVGRTVTTQEYEEAVEWQTDHPGVSLSEYVEAMIEVGGL